MYISHYRRTHRRRVIPFIDNIGTENIYLIEPKSLNRVYENNNNIIIEKYKRLAREYRSNRLYR